MKNAFHKRCSESKHMACNISRRKRGGKDEEDGVSEKRGGGGA